MVIPGKFYPNKLYEWVKFWVKKFSIRERGLRFGLKNHNRPFWDVGRNFFFLWKQKLNIVFFGVEFTGDYREIAIISTLFRDHSRNL